MLRRLLVGCIKGLVLGIGLGLLFQLVLRWTTTPELLAYLLSMGTGATVGVLAGRPPWRQESWLESLLKVVAGVGVGAMVYWLAHTYGSFGLPTALLGAEEGVPWTSLPALYLPPTAVLFGALVELDNTPDGPAPKPRPQPPSPASPKGSDVDIDWDA